MSLLDEAARELAASSRAFTVENLYHALRRKDEALERPSFAQALEARLEEGPIPGLLPAPTPWHGEPLPREWEAYFPRAILMVDRPAILDLFVASGVLATAKMAVVCVDGGPRHVVDWLRRGFRRGHRAPIGYLHDAASVVYPFLLEPLATATEVAADDLLFADLGLPPLGLFGGRFPYVAAAARREIVLELEALPPCAIVAYAARRLLSMTPRDPMMAPLARPAGGTR